MSKIPYTVNVDEYVCSALENIRKMDKNRDYSSLMATVERIQHHAQRMEDVLYSGKSKLSQIRSILEDEDKSNNKKLKEIKGVYKDYD